MKTDRSQQLFLEFGQAVIERLRRWAETEGVRRLRLVSTEFIEDGWRHRVEEFPDFGGLLCSHEKELLASPELDSCLHELLAMGDLKPPELSDSTGAPIVTPTLDQIRSALAGDLLQPIVDAVIKAGTLHPTESQLLQSFESWRTAWRSAGEEWNVTFPIVNFRTKLPLVAFANLSLQRFPPEEKTAISVGMFTSMMSPSDLVAAKFKLAGRRGRKAGALSTDDELVCQARNVITSFRLSKSGRVGLLGCHETRIPVIPHGVMTFHPLRDFFVEGGWGMFELNESDLPAVLTLFRMLEERNDSKQGHHLNVALTRFNKAYGRSSPEDRIIDLVIALESCLLPDRGEELAWRFGLRGAALLATQRKPFETKTLLDSIYQARSKIVHEGKTLGELKFSGLSKQHLQAFALDEQCEELAREVIRTVLPQINQGKDIRSIVANIDKQIVTNLGPGNGKTSS